MAVQELLTKIGDKWTIFLVPRSTFSADALDFPSLNARPGYFTEDAVFDPEESRKDKSLWRTLGSG
ncbi:hypothetical protein [Bradyrhizobium canariense]|uniref:Uncharacterized protein n=1 Tax=Bradyrhizobium canariense TaxID=255045 RepID=A0A1H2BCE4_9BRAD|nr:hypothetical protein [Bradyrhizobium canariense]SDT55923.1 hypothetical protein SAMN05444158_7029 [Bradyrhizobium canariense]